MRLVWKKAPYKGESLLAFLALADWASDEGHCWPKTTALALKARVSRSTAKRALAKLEADGFIEFIHRSRGGIGQHVQLRQGAKRRARALRLGHELLINLSKLESLPDVAEVTSEGEPTGPRTASREAGIAGATGSLWASDEISTTGSERASKDFHNWPTDDRATGPLTIDAPQTPHKEETLFIHEPSVDSSGDGNDFPAVESFRWTLEDADDGRFWSKAVCEAYTRLTGNRVTTADRQNAEALSDCGFSSRAVITLMGYVAMRSSSSIGSLSYFRKSVDELARRCEGAVRESVRMLVGAGEREKTTAIDRAVRREVEEWRTSGGVRAAKVRA
jgi:DNA-binding MarR family transcriptional regulator